MTADAVRAYGARATEYADLLGHEDAVAAPDRELVLRWAAERSGPVVDVGCGPGHWTDLLRRQGADVEGIDPTPQMLDLARERFPACRFRAGRLEDLGVPDGSLAGVLAWFSLIHTPPDEVPAALASVARALRPGGSTLVGFFTGDGVEPFDHAVTTAHRWPVDELTARLAEAGLVVRETHARTDPGVRPQGAIVADRAA
ncbi:class I SAM-dependent methyltransferase [Aeromicrobium massiliense]|uniref:class I SAM-dependent methyltransferase n=1 Tax=Aeromicrobium massiliense TaxID=1464554 RepID=UPI0002EC09C1|nr:class I SAM-dependent methyltransferase [Aeromicrobium massiliense]